MDPDPCLVVVCGGESQPIGPAGTDPNNDQFCHGWVSFGSGWPVGMVAVFANLTGTLGELSFCSVVDGNVLGPSHQCAVVFGIINFSHLVKICGGKWFSIWIAKHQELLDTNSLHMGFLKKMAFSR